MQFIFHTEEDEQNFLADLRELANAGNWTPVMTQVIGALRGSWRSCLGPLSSGRKWKLSQNLINALHSEKWMNERGFVLYHVCGATIIRSVIDTMQTPDGSVVELKEIPEGNTP